MRPYTAGDTTVQAKLHHYYLNLEIAEDREAWTELQRKAGEHGLVCTTFLGDPSKKKLPLAQNQTHVVELEVKHLFENQWNTGPLTDEDESWRVFDWVRYNFPNNKSIMYGHWIEPNEATREVRRNTLKCGYCGHQEPAAKGLDFCPACIDSEYLKESDLHLTRLKTIDDTSQRKPLTEAESARLLPLYLEAQTRGVTERGRKFRERLDKNKRSAIYHATVEHDGMLWLLDAGFGQLADGNTIYYSHKGRFCFGWRKTMGPAEVSKLLDVITEFPFPYEIKCEDGRTLSGD